MEFYENIFQIKCLPSNEFNCPCTDSLPVNAYMCWLAYKFYSAPDASNSRRLFFYRYVGSVIPTQVVFSNYFTRLSLFYLPLIMILMVVSNYGRSDVQKTPLLERIRSFTTKSAES